MGIERSKSKLSYLSGLTNPVQTQLDAKSNSASPTFTGTVTLPTATSIGTVSNAEIAYVDGVTSAIQTQLGTKANLAAPTFTGTVVLPSTTSIGNVTDTEIGYVDGVTSAIQTQLNAKANSASPTFTGEVNALDTLKIKMNSPLELSITPIQTASDSIRTSTDSINFTTTSMPSSQTWVGFSYGNGVFAALSMYSTAAASSTNGINWTPRTYRNNLLLMHRIDSQPSGFRHHIQSLRYPSLQLESHLLK
jgi:hypothetical protein